MSKANPSAAEVRDAVEVFKDLLCYTRAVRGYRGGMGVLRLFRKKVEAKDWQLQSLPISKVKINHDWGRRIANAKRLARPIIVVNAPKGYRVLDGQHRLLTLKETGERHVNAFVITLPVKKP